MQTKYRQKVVLILPVHAPATNYGGTRFPSTSHKLAKCYLLVVIKGVNLTPVWGAGLISSEGEYSKNTNHDIGVSKQCLWNRLIAIIIPINYPNAVSSDVSYITLVSIIPVLLRNDHYRLSGWFEPKQLSAHIYMPRRWRGHFLGTPRGCICCKSGVMVGSILYWSRFLSRS